MSIAYHNRSPIEGSPYPRHASVADLAAWADVLVLTLPGGAATRHIVSSDELAALGPNGFLVNIARGSVVDTAALIAALRHGRIGGAALDVFSQQPLPADHPYFGFDNVILTPHLAGITDESMMRMGVGAVEQTLQVLRGDLPANLRNLEALDAYRKRFPA